MNLTPARSESTADYLLASEPGKYNPALLGEGQSIINLGPTHPSTHGVLRLECLMEGEQVMDLTPHIGYLHRCFEKHAEALPFNQIIPYVDRMDYLAPMNSEHVYAMAVEQMMGITELHPRVEYIRVLVAELNRLASHFLGVGTYAMDIGAFTGFLWLMRDREHILRMFEWLCGARLLYNYIWVGGLFYDLPIGFEARVAEFVTYVRPKLLEFEQLIMDNHIFIKRTANVGAIDTATAVALGATGPVLRATGLPYDLRRVLGYSVYPELDFDIPVGVGTVGTVGDCWDRTHVRVKECQESLRIIDQCVEVLLKKHPRSRDFDPQAACPKKIRPEEGHYYFRGETPRGELGFYIATDGKRDIPLRCKVRSPNFAHVSMLPYLSKGQLVADLVATIGSLDLVMGEVDR